jgi:hypothetical protein
LRRGAGGLIAAPSAQETMMNPTGGTAIFQPLLIAIAVAIVLLLLFLYAVRQGRFASPGARIAAVIVIVIIAVLLWLGPGLFLVR